MINPQQYANSKVAGSVSIVNNGNGTYDLTFKQFDQFTGQATGTITQTQSLAELEQAVTELNSEITIFQTFLTDLQNTQVKAQAPS